MCVRGRFVNKLHTHKIMNFYRNKFENTGLDRGIQFIYCRASLLLKFVIMHYKSMKEGYKYSKPIC